MKPIKLSTIIVLVIMGMFSLSDVCSGIMFTNMGGRLRAQSAKGASAFLSAAGATYLMFAKIETGAIGDANSLREAAVEAKRSLQYITVAIEKFKSIRQSKRELNKLTAVMQKSERYDSAVHKAAVFLGPQIDAQIKRTTMKEGALGLLNLSIDNMEMLISPKSSMGKTYDQIIKGTVPGPELLWAAARELDIALQTGRLSSSLFGEGQKR